METVSVKEEKRNNTSKAAIPLLWVSIVAMIMIFGSLTSGYIVSRGNSSWLHFELPQLFYVSTAVIMISSVTMNWTLSSAKKNNYKGIKIGSLLTFLLGLTFVICQFKAWEYLVDQKIFFTGPTSNVSASYLYVITALHLAHLAFGLVAVLVVWVKSLLQRYSSENLLGIRLCAIFWHFLDVLWIFLFLFLLFIR
jgi:cytochrome c oxidase subunit 3